MHDSINNRIWTTPRSLIKRHFFCVKDIIAFLTRTAWDRGYLKSSNNFCSSLYRTRMNIWMFYFIATLCTASPWSPFRFQSVALAEPKRNTDAISDTVSGLSNTVSGLIRRVNMRKAQRAKQRKMAELTRQMINQRITKTVTNLLAKDLAKVQLDQYI